MPDDAAHALVSGVEVVVPLKELIDVDAELDKLARERKALEQDLQRVRGKLEELESRLAKNEESRGRLGEVEVRQRAASAAALYRSNALT